MPTHRDTDSRTGGTKAQDWQQMSSPHGYDQPEFEPGVAHRDYKRGRQHEADAERRHLREVEAAMDGPDPHDSASGAKKGEKWDKDENIDTPVSRLYRD
ncbi:hypothetical protein ABLE91_07140 [Aquabacter sp. CN5-332]|uniref:hypothetical protein n=1 Tax=Aquabacter sp. CN5-332 TaxID=3156608 RepID=UPI0032B49E3F